MGLTAAEANRRFYAEYADFYDRTECCVVDAHQQQRLNGAIDRAVALLPDAPQILDACGGSGNAGRSLARHGLYPVVVDVSAEMTALWDAKVRRAGATPEIHIQTVESFLDADPRSWDLITFCSALHHLEDPHATLTAAAARLSPGGLILTMFDPTPGGRLLRAARRGDWLLEVMRRDPRQFARIARGVRERRARHEDASEHVGRMAERHAYAGVDDRLLMSQLRTMGMEVLEYERYIDARTALIREVLSVARRPSHFRLLLRRPPR